MISADTSHLRLHASTALIVSAIVASCMLVVFAHARHRIRGAAPNEARSRNMSIHEARHDQ